jgi:hypothetical protein
MAFKIKKDRTKWQILGTGSGWEHAPKTTDNIVLALNDYVFSERYGIHPDILCIMDVLDEKPQIVAGINNLGEVVERINQLRIPLIAPYKYAEIPLSQPFPLKSSIKEFGLPYFTNTIAYMIAFALLNGAQEINIYGVNQASSSEYFYEKAGVEYMLGIAVGRGVKVTINGEKSELLGNKRRFGGNLLYGYNQTLEEIFAAEKKFGIPIIKKLSAPTTPKARTISKRVN